MSYVVAIKRATPIAVEELREVVAGDPEFHIPAGDTLASDVLNVLWQPSPGDAAVGFVLSAGVIEVTTPSNSALRKMQRVASTLAARLIGEGGEDLTDVDTPQSEVSPRGLIGCVSVAILLLAGFSWLVLR